jgi:hypothetical protein
MAAVRVILLDAAHPFFFVNVAGALVSVHRRPFELGSDRPGYPCVLRWSMRRFLAFVQIYVLGCIGVSWVAA